MKKLTTLPKWFNGTIYDKGDTVTNPFSGDTYKLTNLELSMYDFIIGCQMVIEMTGASEDGLKAMNYGKNMARALHWFRTNNGKAYMVLLD
jgi:hypothetical protein